ncbi:PKHD-type hydroxylase [Stella humosa]|uniref:PKHD-type hydroxylase n=1 Tax=Stella humosa TaxID=94 RepID=A0A3N1KY39_9PROT|nr:Fe2+-dependent dioxygenase [Stella humosa]ROP83699.1 PKHD-type hydroxylase [Stella humosa]BBK33029.1 PKHD-type hydroxylase [Stella humosa]
MLTHIPAVLSGPALARVRALVEAGPFEDGTATASGQAAAVKRNLQIAADPARRRPIDELVMPAILGDPRFVEVAFPKVMAPPTYNRYDVGMTYGDHVDAPFLSSGRVRADISLTLFLSEPEEYEGGALTIRHGDAQFLAKHKAGDLVAYPTTSLHHVSPVTRGKRLAAVSWVQSYVPDERHRRILYELGEAKKLLDRTAPGAPETDALRNGLFNLLRLWWQP